MAARPGYAQPDPRNPFANLPMPQPHLQQYQQVRRDYDAESDVSDPFGSRNGSTAQLASHSHYDDSGQYDSPCEYHTHSHLTLVFSQFQCECIVLSLHQDVLIFISVDGPPLQNSCLTSISLRVAAHA
jgi:hypothetical protein